MDTLGLVHSVHTTLARVAKEETQLKYLLISEWINNVSLNGVNNVSFNGVPVSNEKNEIVKCVTM